MLTQDQKDNPLSREQDRRVCGLRETPDLQVGVPRDRTEGLCVLLNMLYYYELNCVPSSSLCMLMH